jgi:hypothetical protein
VQLLQGYLKTGRLGKIKELCLDLAAKQPEHQNLCQQIIAYVKANREKDIQELLQQWNPNNE